MFYIGATSEINTAPMSRSVVDVVAFLRTDRALKLMKIWMPVNVKVSRKGQGHSQDSGKHSFALCFLTQTSPTIPVSVRAQKETYEATDKYRLL